jgi:hypothetical protein
MDELLLEFELLFTAPTRLPPSHACTHRFQLLPCMALVAVRPYRYTHGKKEMEK